MAGSRTSRLSAPVALEPARLDRATPRFLLLVALPLALVVALATPLYPQVACAIALLVAVLAVYASDRQRGLFALLALWFVVPGVRRVLGYTTVQLANDPLSLLPFVATAGAALIELTRARIPRPGLLAATAIGVAFAIGLPLGFAEAPLPAMFAFGAYVSGLGGGLLLGATLPRDEPIRVLFRAVLVLVPLIALYALWQRIAGLPRWDQAWLDFSGFWSIIVEREGALRVFSTLNSPGTLAPLLAFGLLAALVLRRRPTFALAFAALCGVALALTYVRSAWLALIAGALAFVFATRGRALPAVAGFAITAVAVTALLSPVSPAAREVVARVRTISAASSDRSVNERRQTLAEQLPASLTKPLGHGVGSAGEPSRLRGETPLRAPDNGYLSLLYQLGPVGFGLVAMVLAAAAGRASRLLREDEGELRAWAFALLAYYLVQLTAQDTFYGVHGVILGLLLGWALGSPVGGGDRRLPRTAAVDRRALADGSRLR